MLYECCSITVEIQLVCVCGGGGVCVCGGGGVCMCGGVTAKRNITLLYLSTLSWQCH